MIKNLGKLILSIVILLQGTSGFSSSSPDDLALVPVSGTRWEMLPSGRAVLAVAAAAVLPVVSVVPAQCIAGGVFTLCMPASTGLLSWFALETMRAQLLNTAAANSVAVVSGTVALAALTAKATVKASQWSYGLVRQYVL